jgi:hypothetical protein
VETTDWVISISAGFISLLIGMVAYFAQKWIASVDETISESSKELRDLNKQVVALKAGQAAQAANFRATVQAEIATVRFPTAKLDGIETELQTVKTVVQGKLLPHAEAQAANLGRVILIETALREQDKKLVGMFSVLEVLVQKMKGPK